MEKQITSVNPSNKEVIGKVVFSSKKEVKNKVNKSRKAQIRWYNIGLEKRIEIMKNVSNSFEESSESLSILISQEMGMPISQAIDEIGFGLEYLNWYIENAKTYLSPEITFEDENQIHKVLYEPKGVVASIAPWNYPFSMFIWIVMQNLIVGNTVVFKHSEETSLVSKEIEKTMNNSNLPEGVFEVVYGDGSIGDILVHENIDMICFTGSVETGQYLYKVAAEKFIPVVMELGGSAPGIICENADIDKVLETIYTFRFSNCGQMCDGLKRLIVHESKYNEVLKKLSAFLEKRKNGLAEDKNTEIGPLVSEHQVKIIKDQADDSLKKGASIYFQSKIDSNLKGFFYPPTILTNISKDMRVWKEEVFGPVLPVMKFKTIEEAIKLANDTIYGLGGYVFTENKKLFEKIAKSIKTGMVEMNNYNYVFPCNPFGGCKKSGIGREHGKHGFHELSNIKVISMEK